MWSLPYNLGKIDSFYNGTIVFFFFLLEIIFFNPKVNLISQPNFRRRRLFCRSLKNVLKDFLLFLQFRWQIWPNSIFRMGKKYFNFNFKFKLKWNAYLFRFRSFKTLGEIRRTGNEIFCCGIELFESKAFQITLISKKFSKFHRA